MKLLKSNQIKEVDAYTIDNEPVLSINLMERAARQCSKWIAEHIPRQRKINVFVGPGNNGGDGLAIARQLADEDFHVKVFLVEISSKLSEDAEINLGRLKSQGKAGIFSIDKESPLPEIPENEIIVDGLFGSGLNRPLEGFPSEVVKHLNKYNVTRIAIDTPSGLFGEDNSQNNYESIFKADYTLTFQFPSLSFFYPENEDYVGKWYVMDIGLSQEKINEITSPYYLITEEFIKNHLKKRKRFAHKGHFGHVLMINGGYGKMGAAILAAKAALKTGSGLVTAHLPKTGYSIMQTAVPEVMISIDISDIIFSDVPDLQNFSNVGGGCGLGTKQNTQNALKTLIEKETRPLVLDADALNILSENKEWLNNLPENSILTPHPKEFERLTEPAEDHYSRLELQREFARKYKVILVLKGGNTSIALPDGRCYFNITGGPAMASAGSGDVLTGMITSLVGQKYDPYMAAIMGVYLHGLAGNIASEEWEQEAVIASDIINSIGKAFKQLKS